MSAIRAALKRFIRGMGYTVSRAGGPADLGTMQAAFRSLVARGHRFGSVVDIGASNASWSAELMPHFPDCRYLLIEAQAVHEPALRDYCRRHRNVEYLLAAAGDRAGEVFFDGDEPFGGQASHAASTRANLRVPMVTIDDEVRARKLDGPYLLKFDTHGFEVPILKGAVTTLARTEAIVMECYNFRIAPECLTFDEMCRYLGERGFRCIHLIEPLHRPYDGAFWQMDLVFVRSDRPEFTYRRYR